MAPKSAVCEFLPEVTMLDQPEGGGKEVVDEVFHSPDGGPANVS